MSEAVATNTVPDEINKQIAEAQKAIGGMDKPALLVKAQELGLNVDPASVNEKWLQRKLKYLVQAQILAANGLSETPGVKKNHEKLDKEDPTKPSIGRKRMSTSGVFMLAIPEGGNEGRGNSAKGKIVAAMKEAKTFTYDQFKAAVSAAYEWDEDSAGFNGTTRFKTLEQATAAWWSELKNKAKIITEAPATPAQ